MERVFDRFSRKITAGVFSPTTCAHNLSLTFDSGTSKPSTPAKRPKTRFMEISFTHYESVWS